MKQILETQRLTIREFVLEDLPEFFRMVGDPEITRYTGDGATTLAEAQQGMEQRLFRDYQTHGYGRWAVVLKATGKVIGFAGLKCLDDVNETDLGYRLFKEHWGQGLATEACRPILRFGFDVLRLRRIIGIADIENKASIRVLEKVGFKFEKFATYRGHDVAWYAVQARSSPGALP